MSEEYKKVLVLHTMVKGVERKQKFFAGVEDVGVLALTEGPETTLSRTDGALSAADTIRKAVEAERDGYKAIVLSCHGDPELYPLREAVRIPVLGTMEIAMRFCAMLSHKFSVLVPELWIKRQQEDNAIRYGLESKIASIRVVSFRNPLAEVSELALRRPIPQGIIEPALGECIKAIEEDDATAITFGCGCFTGMGEELGRQLKAKGFDVLVINPLPLAVEVARALINLGLTQSALAYPPAELPDNICDKSRNYLSS